MNKEAIYHKSLSNYAYSKDEESLHIILRVKKDDVDEVNLICGDSSEFVDGKWVYQKISMQLEGSGELFDYWKIEHTPRYRRLRYCFEIYFGDEKWYYTEKGFYDQLQDEDVNYHFCFPYIHKSELFSAPNWVKDTIWYQIFPERFANGKKELNPSGTKEWGSEAPAYNNFFGGDFPGVIQHLDYLEELGVTGIYFTPIFKAISNHKYDTVDYLEIDPQFGDKKDFKKLVSECHKRGIRVIIDAVFNHSSDQFPPFKDVIAHGEESKYKEWFYIHKDGSIQNNNIVYDTFGFEPTMPKLNLSNKEVSNYFLEIARYWTKEFNIDGWRLDVASEADPLFWQSFRNEVKSINPEAYILGEIWHDSLPWLKGDKFDAVMNYPYTYAVNDFFAKQIISTKEFKEKMVDTLFLYPRNVNEVQFNLLDSHDTPRTLTMVNEDSNQLKLMYFFHFTAVGTPCIYYGTEVGMTGSYDPDNRKCMIWDEEKQDRELFYFFQKLISIRKKNGVLRNEGSFKFLDTEENKGIVYERQNEFKKVICFINPQKEKLKLKVKKLENERALELLTEEIYEINDTGEIILEPQSCIALELKV